MYGKFPFNPDYFLSISHWL